MSKYGNIHDSKFKTPQEFRVDNFISIMRDIHFGNCDIPTELQDYIIRDKKGIEDIFLTDNGLYILPKSIQSAKYLFDVCTGEKNIEYNEYENSLADEIDWMKIGDRYWLSLWWD